MSGFTTATPSPDAVVSAAQAKSLQLESEIQSLMYKQAQDNAKLTGEAAQAQSDFTKAQYEAEAKNQTLTSVGSITSGGMQVAGGGTGIVGESRVASNTAESREAMANSKDWQNKLTEVKQRPAKALQLQNGNQGAVDPKNPAVDGEKAKNADLKKPLAQQGYTLEQMEDALQYLKDTDKPSYDALTRRSQQEYDNSTGEMRTTGEATRQKFSGVSSLLQGAGYTLGNGMFGIMSADAKRDAGNNAATQQLAALLTELLKGVMNQQNDAGRQIDDQKRSTIQVQAQVAQANRA